MNLFNFFKSSSPAHNEIAENGADKVLSSEEENPSVHKTYVNFLTSRKSALDVPLYAISFLFSFLRRVLQMRRNFSTTCTTLGTRGEKLQADAALCGRSMVEMLGVLAIIGVLSVGAMSGYSKAMMKYKLNKQTEQIGSILDYATLHYEDLDRIDVPNGTNITRLFTKLGAIPLEMIKEQNTSYIYDVFNNKIFLYHNKESSGTQYYGLEVFIDKNAYDICLNLFQMAKLRSSTLWITEFAKATEDDDQHLGNVVYGDNYCNKDDIYCLKDLTLEQMYELCSYCSDSLDRCSFYFLWNLK